MSKTKVDQKARNEIMKSALALFAKKGFNAVSIREISKLSGHNISMISYYFGSKEGLYKAIFEEHLIVVVEHVGLAFSNFKNGEITEKTFKQGIKKVVSVATEMKFNDPEMMMLVQREKVDGIPFAREFHEKYLGPIIDQIVDYFKLAQKKKIIRSDIDPRAFLGVMLEAIQGYITSSDCGLASLKGDYKFPRDKEKFINFITDVFLEGIVK